MSARKCMGCGATPREFDHVFSMTGGEVCDACNNPTCRHRQEFERWARECLGLRRDVNVIQLVIKRPEPEGRESWEARGKADIPIAQVTLPSPDARGGWDSEYDRDSHREEVEDWYNVLDFGPGSER